MGKELKVHLNFDDKGYGNYEKWQIIASLADNNEEARRTLDEVFEAHRLKMKGKEVTNEEILDGIYKRVNPQDVYGSKTLGEYMMSPPIQKIRKINHRPNLVFTDENHLTANFVFKKHSNSFAFIEALNKFKEIN